MAAPTKIEQFGWARNVLAIVTILALLITSAGWAYIKGYQVDQNTERIEKHQQWMTDYEKIDRINALALQELNLKQSVIKETVLEIKTTIDRIEQASMEKARKQREE